MEFLRASVANQKMVANIFELGVGLIGSQVIGGFVIINKSFTPSCSSFSEISYCGMRDFDTIHFPEGAGSGSGREAKIDIVCKTKLHDMG